MRVIEQADVFSFHVAVGRNPAAPRKFRCGFGVGLKVCGNLYALGFRADIDRLHLNITGRERSDAALENSVLRGVPVQESAEYESRRIIETPPALRSGRRFVCLTLGYRLQKEAAHTMSPGSGSIIRRCR